jgi:uncharacterized protein (TIGR03067 family)
MKPYFPLALLLLAGCSPEPVDPVSDRDKLQGDWQAVWGEVGGRSRSPAELQGYTLSFRGSDLVIRDNKKTEQPSFKLHPTKRPKEIELSNQNGFGGMWGIYVIDGDKLTICLGGKQAPPKEFATNGLNNFELYVLHRMPAAKPAVPADSKPSQ